MWFLLNTFQKHISATCAGGSSLSALSSPLSALPSLPVSLSVSLDASLDVASLRPQTDRWRRDHHPPSFHCQTQLMKRIRRLPTNGNPLNVNPLTGNPLNVNPLTGNPPNVNTLNRRRLEHALEPSNCTFETNHKISNLVHFARMIVAFSLSLANVNASRKPEQLLIKANVFLPFNSYLL